MLVPRQLNSREETEATTRIDGDARSLYVRVFGREEQRFRCNTVRGDLQGGKGGQLSPCCSLARPTFMSLKSFKDIKVCPKASYSLEIKYEFTKNTVYNCKSNLRSLKNLVKVN